MRQQLQQAALVAIDGIAAALPQTAAHQSTLQSCKIIAHRGEHDNHRVIENTLQAFESARSAGVWGIECDIRWTRDSVPVIHHDASCSRLFGHPKALRDMNFPELRKRFPLIPSLEEVLSEFGQDRHLMLEIKEHHPREAAHHKNILRDLLSPLTPGNDFHFLMLDPALADAVDFLPRCYCILVAELNIAHLSRVALEEGFGGLSGHFLLLNKRMKQRHDLAGQQIGTGFISSRNALFRELNRGVEWIFSNHSARIQAVRDACLNH